MSGLIIVLLFFWGILLFVRWVADSDNAGAAMALLQIAGIVWYFASGTATRHIFAITPDVLGDDPLVRVFFLVMVVSAFSLFVSIVAGALEVALTVWMERRDGRGQR